jgi:hypothetical protein
MTAIEAILCQQKEKCATEENRGVSQGEERSMNGGGEAKQLNAGTGESLAHIHTYTRARTHNVCEGTSKIKGIKP